MLELGNLEMLGRVGLAALLGGAVGLEREISGQPAGFRTHVALALGAALFGLISIHAFAPFEGTTDDTNVRIDVTRVASTVVTGVGFLGAGAIIKYGGSIRGLTTAASLWATAAVGLAVGVGYFAAAFAGTVALIGSLFGLRSVRRVVRRRLSRDEEEVTVRLVPGASTGEVVMALHSLPGVEVPRLHVDQDPDTRSIVIAATVKGVAAHRLKALLVPLAERDDVDELHVAGR